MTCDLRDLHVLTPSFPPRRSSDLLVIRRDMTRDGCEPAVILRDLVHRVAEPPVPASRLGRVRLRVLRIGLGERVAPEGANIRIKVTVAVRRSEEHTSELQSLMRISYAVFCLQKKKKKNTRN